jgi:4-amino-4-deoxy-L-arabinose transferase-like glycosyltransferase
MSIHITSALMRRHLPFVFILVGTAILRFAILFTSQTHVTSDEAIIGLMGKHISEGRAFPFYFYGISYNASCAWEAYLAVIPFAIAGVGVVALKVPTVLLSLVCLTLFYAMTARLYSIRVASWAALIFSLWPGLLKWHFQPRGYAFYFLFIPALVILFLRIEDQNARRVRDFFLFGLACGVAFWGMELLLITIVALWILLLLRRRFSVKTFGASLGGFAIGYAPAIWWNLTHSMRNWHFLFFEKPEAGGLATRFGLQAWRGIFSHEMPKFFSDDTVLWYYPETKWTGYVLYLATALALILAGRSALRQIGNVFRSGFAINNATKDLLMLILIGFSFVPYVIAPLRVPGYFLGASFFMSILLARAIDEPLGQNKFVTRATGAAVLLATIICGAAAVIDTASRNQIETLTLSPNRQDHKMLRVPGADIDSVKQDLEQNGIKAVWTTVSFVYPLIFETNEKLIASESIFGVDRVVYPPSIPKPEPSDQHRAVFVIETKSPYREQIESTLALKGDAPPRIREHGVLTVIEQQFASELSR